MQSLISSNLSRLTDTPFNEHSPIAIYSDSLITYIADENGINNIYLADYKNEISVSYSGAIPNLFAEEKGVVAEGFLKDKNFFSATKILAKHDENYMPPEVKEALGDK